MDPVYDIRDLARLTGESPRTVHYYIQCGLVPPAGVAGRGKRYHDGHVARLRVIRRLQREHLPLGEIRTRLESLSDEDLVRLDRETTTPQRTENAETPSAGSALDYVQRVLEGERRSSSTADFLRSSPTRTRRSDVSGGGVPPSPAANSGRGTPRDLRADAAARRTPPVTVTLSAPPSSPVPVERSQWERVSLTPDIELHVRRPQSRDMNRRIDALLETARRLLTED